MTPLLSQLSGALRALAPVPRAPDDEVFTADQVARLHDVVPPTADDMLDEPTWRDLMLDRYLDTLAPGTSIFGRQVLARRLRGGSNAAQADAGRARIERMLEDPAQHAALRDHLACLRHADIEVATLLFADSEPARPGWVAYLLWLPVLLMVSIVGALLVSPWCWLGAGAAMYGLLTTHMRYADRIAIWMRSVRALQMLLRAVALLDTSSLALAQEFYGRGAAAGRLSRSLSRSLIGSLIPGANEYGDWFMAADVRHYHRTVALVFGQRDLLRACFWLCADLEADVTLARHLRARDADGLAWCWSTRAADRTLTLEGGVHPLLAGARGLSIALDSKGAFLSGQNGVGKSTFLRMLGLNLATARAFGFCYAARADLPPLPVVASMQNEDSLLSGQSLYVAELARACALLAAAGRAQPVICLVDEIFRGTNHEESVAAAAAVVDELADRALVVVSSHNLVLGALLAHVLDPWRVVRDAGGGLLLERGVLGQTNGVALLAEHGFDDQVQRKAAQVAGWLAGQRRSEEGVGLLAER